MTREASDFIARFPHLASKIANARHALIPSPSRQFIAQIDSDCRDGQLHIYWLFGVEGHDSGTTILLGRKTIGLFFRARIVICEGDDDAMIDRKFQFVSFQVRKGDGVSIRHGSDLYDKPATQEELTGGIL